MAKLFSTEFQIDTKELDKLGVFNALLDEDSNFFVNIKRLQVTTVPEFIGAYEQINKRFENIGVLLQNSKKGDRFYREALKLFNFHEVNGINLGFAKSVHGAGFGKKLRDKVIDDAYEIIKTGSTQPEIFHLIGLFEENVGSDRLSDMIASLIEDRIIAYTKRINSELQITKQNYPSYQFDDGIVINPYKNIKLLLLPVDILHKLPIARCWEDIDRACRENEAIRKEMNKIIAFEWDKMTTANKKRCLFNYIFRNSDSLRNIVESYRELDVTPIDLLSDIEYVINNFKDRLSDITIPQNEDSYHVSLAILDNFKSFVENNSGYKLLASKNGYKEKDIQKIIHAIAFIPCKANNWNISPEVDNGRGPADFVISRGNDKTVIEVKLTSNPKCEHGLAVQIEEYAKAEGTDKKIFVLVDNGNHSERKVQVHEKAIELQRMGGSPATIIDVCTIPKQSASRYCEDEIEKYKF